jgi:hypothetical protein
VRGETLVDSPSQSAIAVMYRFQLEGRSFSYFGPSVLRPSSTSLAQPPLRGNEPLPSVSDLSPLVELKSLKYLELRNTKLSFEQVQELRQALPNCRIRHSIRAEK